MLYFVLEVYENIFRHRHWQERFVGFCFLLKQTSFSICKMSEKANFERDVIRIYFECGKSFNQTVRTYHTKKGLKKHTFDHSKVRRIIQKFNKGQFNLQRKPGSGRIPMFPDGDTTVVDAAQELMNSNVHGVSSGRIGF